MNSFACILDCACYLPSRVETLNEICEQNPGWDADRLVAKIGIRQRHIADTKETATDMAVAAAEKLLNRHPQSRETIDYVLFCTQSPDYFLPSSACIIQNQLKLQKNLGALDFNLGCSGYVYGLQLAASLIIAKQAHNVLLLTADTYTKYVHPQDRSTRPVFGDAATATLISSEGERGKLERFSVGTDGSGKQHIIVPAGGMRMPRSAETGKAARDNDGNTRTCDNLHMDGPAVFAFVIANIPKTVKAHLASVNLSMDEVDFVIFHQANQFMLEALAQRMKIPSSKMIIDVENFGNTVSSTIPLAFARAVENGRIQPGNRVLFVGFGVGLSWAVGSCVL